MLTKTTFVPKHALPLGSLGLEVQHHAALRVPHDHSPEDATFDQHDQGSNDLVMHLRQPAVAVHSVLN